MNITLYSSFYKRHNSTKLPPVDPGLSAVTYNCYLLDATSITNPVITIEREAIERPFVYTFNYAYISDFNRYYFIDDITSVNNLWVFRMSVDVLASYKSAILSSSQYVVRSSSASDDNIVDSMYITKPLSLSDRCAVSEYNTGNVSRTIRMHTDDPATAQVFYFNYDNRVPENGVCFGVVGGNGVGANYYICTETEFINFMTRVFALVPADMGNMGDAMKKILMDLQQYIVSVVRLPVMPHSSNLAGAVTSVRLGTQDIPCDCYGLSPGYHYEEYSLVNELTIPQHPNISTHAYYALPPFTQYYLDFLPIGSVPLDAAKLYGYNKIQIKWRVDFVSGLAYFKVGFEPYYDHFITLYTDIAQVGIPIPLSQLKVDNVTGFGLILANSFANYADAGFAPLQADDKGNGLKYYNAGGQKFRFPFSEIGEQIGTGLRSLFTGSSETQSLDQAIGNFTESNGDVLHKAVDYASEILGNVSTKGSTGTYLNIVAGRPTVRAFFLGQGDEDNARFGRPLYQVKTLSTLSGFCVCKNATFTSSGLASALPVEVSGIVNLLNSGIYLE